VTGDVRREEEEAAVPRGPFEAMRAGQAHRKRQLIDALTGRAQPRDYRGRFAKPASFHGGARQTLPPRPESHEETLSRVLRTGEANVGGHI
jgi:hypothetical protein